MNFQLHRCMDEVRERERERERAYGTRNGGKEERLGSEERNGAFRESSVDRASCHYVS